MDDGAQLCADGLENRGRQVGRWLAEVSKEAKALAQTRAQARDAYDRMLAPSGISYEGRDMPGSPNAYGNAIPDGLARIELMQGAEAFVDVDALTGAVEVITGSLHGLVRLWCLARYVGVTGGVGLSSPAFAGPLTWQQMESAFGTGKTTMRLAVRAALPELWEGMPTRYRDPGSQALPET